MLITPQALFAYCELYFLSDLLGASLPSDPGVNYLCLAKSPTFCGLLRTKTPLSAWCLGWDILDWGFGAQVLGPTLPSWGLGFLIGEIQGWTEHLLWTDSPGHLAVMQSKSLVLPLRWQAGGGQRR